MRPAWKGGIAYRHRLDGHSVVGFGQKRVLIVWRRIVLPDGSSIRIDNVTATANDAAGYAGLEDKVDLHSLQLIKGVALSALLGASSTVVSDIQNTAAGCSEAKIPLPSGTSPD